MAKQVRTFKVTNDGWHIHFAGSRDHVGRLFFASRASAVPGAAKSRGGQPSLANVGAAVRISRPSGNGTTFTVDIERQGLATVKVPISAESAQAMFDHPSEDFREAFPLDRGYEAHLERKNGAHMLRFKGTRLGQPVEIDVPVDDSVGREFFNNQEEFPQRLWLTDYEIVIESSSDRPDVVGKVRLYEPPPHLEHPLVLLEIEEGQPVPDADWIGVELTGLARLNDSYIAANPKLTDLEAGQHAQAL